MHYKLVDDYKQNKRDNKHFKVEIVFRNAPDFRKNHRNHYFQQSVLISRSERETDIRNRAIRTEYVMTANVIVIAENPHHGNSFRVAPDHARKRKKKRYEG